MRPSGRRRLASCDTGRQTGRRADRDRRADIIPKARERRRQRRRRRTDLAEIKK